MDSRSTATAHGFAPKLAFANGSAMQMPGQATREDARRAARAEAGRYGAGKVKIEIVSAREFGAQLDRIIANGTEVS